MPVHPLAVVDPAAEIHPDAVVGPFCMIRGAVRLAAGVELVSHVVVSGRTSIGPGTRVHPGAIVGGEPQDLKYAGEDTATVIGARCRIHEFATIHRGTLTGGGITRLGDDVLVMAYAHIAHDCEVGDGVVIANSAQLGGHCRIGRRAVIGGMVGMHHFVTVGELAMVGAMSGVRVDVPPYVLADGIPCEPRQINVIGLRRAGMTESDINDLREAFRDLYHDRGATTLRDAIADVRERYTDKRDSPVWRLCDWLEEHLTTAIKGRLAEAHRAAVVGGRAHEGPTRPILCRHCGREFPAPLAASPLLVACTHCGTQQMVSP
ncbi:MAG: acyl-ACP--UDP-N-acetylglucosamine O-acyltransferase [Planctomycetota bacterium]|nr:acyl-ACP--UDP-N-acetylglucosamine O-acyltransferase [Planctomycetota bacterium]MDW8372191.1 acyl-ACP--UDP-N-acetylglucosamine O-acyltransferase [Planctomycetota bacterium]